MRRLLLAAIALILAVCVQSAKAQDLTITVLNTDINAGDTGFIDVMIQSTNPAVPVGIASAGFEFLITPISTIAHPNTNRLEFDIPNIPSGDVGQPQDSPSTDPASPYQHSYLTDPKYLFFNNSAAVLNENPPGTPVPLAIGAVQSDRADYIGGDNVNTPGDVMVSTAVLLVRLKLTTNPTQGSAPGDGDQFTVELQSGSSGTDFKNQVQLDAGGSLTFLETPGIVTVRTRSVPEPGSLVLLAVGIPAAGWMLRRRKLRAVSAE